MKLVMRHFGEFGLVRNGLLGRWVVLPGAGEQALRPVIPEGGARAVEWNGAKRQLPCRSYILHVLHNSRTGGHLDWHQLEDKVKELCWMPRLAELCKQWVRRCPGCRAVKARTQASTSWRNDRHTTPIR